MALSLVTHKIQEIRAKSHFVITPPTVVERLPAKKNEKKRKNTENKKIKKTKEKGWWVFVIVQGPCKKIRPWLSRKTHDFRRLGAGGCWHKGVTVGAYDGHAMPLTPKRVSVGRYGGQKERFRSALDLDPGSFGLAPGPPDRPPSTARRSTHRRPLSRRTTSQTNNSRRRKKPATATFHPPLKTKYSRGLDIGNLKIGNTFRDRKYRW